MEINKSEWIEEEERQKYWKEENEVIMHSDGPKGREKRIWRV